MNKFLSLLLFLFLAFISQVSLATEVTESDSRPFDYIEWQTEVDLSQYIKSVIQDDVERVFITSMASDSPVYAIKNNALYRYDTDITEASALTKLNDLPAAVGPDRLSLVNETLYLSVPGDLPKVFYLTLSDPDLMWLEMTDLPSEMTTAPIITGAGNLLYFVTLQESYSYDQRLGTWQSIKSPTELFETTQGFKVGESHFFYVSLKGNDSRILVYHTVTNNWFFVDQLPITDNLLSVYSDGLEFNLLTKNQLVTGKATFSQSNFELLDYVVLISLALVVVWIGVHHSREKNQSSGDYYRAGNRIPWWAATLSIFATNASAITIMSMPAMAFTGNWIYVTIAIYLIIIQVPLYLYVFVPIIRRLNFPTANKYLEMRYGVSMRMLGFAGFSLNQIFGRMAAIMLLPAVALNAIFGLPLNMSIIVIGIFTTLFVTAGGLAAVIWTDVFLAILMLVIVVVSCLFALGAIELTFAESWTLLKDMDKLYMFDFRLDLAAPVVLVLFLNSLATSLTYIGDQNVVQRIQCTPTEKGAKKASIAHLIVAVPLNFILFGLGTLIFLYYVTRPEELSPAMKMDGIYPFFASTALPAGMAGLVVLALMAATISTISSALNSVSNLGVEDIYRRFKTDATDSHCLKLGRRITLILGIFGTLVALWLANSTGLQSIWNLFLMVTGLILGPVTGIFILGIFTARANLIGAWAGSIASVVANVIAKNFFDLHATVFLTVGVSTCIIVGYLVSLMVPDKQSKHDGLTIFSLR